MKRTPKAPTSNAPMTPSQKAAATKRSRKAAQESHRKQIQIDKRRILEGLAAGEKIYQSSPSCYHIDRTEVEGDAVRLLLRDKLIRRVGEEWELDTPAAAATRQLAVANQRDANERARIARWRIKIIGECKGGTDDAIEDALRRIASFGNTNSLGDPHEEGDWL